VKRSGRDATSLCLISQPQPRKKKLQMLIRLPGWSWKSHKSRHKCDVNFRTFDCDLPVSGVAKNCQRSGGTDNELVDNGCGSLGNGAAAVD
jgi:hypothetical protein